MKTKIRQDKIQIQEFRDRKFYFLMELNISINWNYELENEDVLLDSSYSNSLPWKHFQIPFFGRVSCIDHSQHTHPHMKTVWGTNIPMPWVCTLIQNVRLFIFLPHTLAWRERTLNLYPGQSSSLQPFQQMEWASGTAEKHLDLKSPCSLAQSSVDETRDLSLYSISF